MKLQIPPKKTILSILSIKDNLFDRYGTYPIYSEILKYLVSKNFYYEEELPIPSIKDISKATGINYYQTRKRIYSLYDLVFEEENPPFISFNKIEYIISASSRKMSFQIKVKSLPYIPKIGEEVNLEIMEGKLGTSMFYVKDIWHSFEQDKQTVFIVLKEGSYNLFWHFRKDEAYSKREFSVYDFIEMDDYHLKQKMGLW